MKAREAIELGLDISTLVQAGHMKQAYSLLAPVLARRTPFALLGRIGDAVGVGSLQPVNDFLELIAVAGTMGRWVIIASALGRQLDRDPAGAFARCRTFIVAAAVWYGPDILGERVSGPALVSDFEPALALLTPWREDANRWVRRAVGVSVHFWTKRSRGRKEHTAQAEALLAFLAPMFEEWDMDAVKGIGWGLKTLGRYYPHLVTNWLEQRVAHRQRHHRALMLRKALTYLSEEQRARVTGSGS